MQYHSFTWLSCLGSIQIIQIWVISNREHQIWVAPIQWSNMLNFLDFLDIPGAKRGQVPSFGANSDSFRLLQRKKSTMAQDRTL